jgi:8-oxo-dGTP pyrophosphatase MutT (NUDIX family)
MSRLPLFDPEELPVIVTADDLPAAPADRLTAAALRERFRRPPAWQPELLADRQGLERAPARAAVLIALVQRDELTVLLTRRTDHLRHHAGQISFPGGRAEPDDADAAATALREAREEVGLAAGEAEVIGLLPDYTTITRFVVTPVVALVAPDFTLRPDAFEVEEVFEVPLAFLMNPAHHERRGIEIEGATREFFSMPWPGVDALGTARRYFIWGATAAMLRNFYRFLSA